MRTAATLVILVLVLGSGAACGNPSGSRGPGAAPPSAAASPTPGPALSHVQVTGGLSGVVDGSAAGPCGALGGALAVDIRFSLGGRAYALTIGLAEYRGPATYPAPPARVAVHTTGSGGGSPVFYSGVRGTVTVNAGGRSGTVEEDLADEAGPAHVSGTWSCG